ncbi:dioxygenase [Pseudomonas japonica]|uniref:dioxygenase n=1 Tax=Pseudomonas japonica TaxID=256466 RepID=UPI0015E34AB5|nr:dioxygenase [Pseudomonas japonica]MBA1242441.1 6-chlorohydroxyquinol-1,2-dioxygenase [Pseudomonas japonica]
MRNLDETTITQAVLATHRNAPNARLNEVMTSLVQHLHAFARDIRLSEHEWRQGVAFLQQAGQASSASHCELALLSHVLGLSTLVLAQHSARPGGCTEPAALEQRPGAAAALHDLDADISASVPGPRGWVHGTVRDPMGKPIPHARVRVTASGNPSAPAALLQADGGGTFRFACAMPQPQRMLAQGPVNDLLQALDRPAWRPAHMTFEIDAAGYRPLTTSVFQEGDPYLACDALFGVRAGLIAEWKQHPPGPQPNGVVSQAPFHTLEFDFVLAPA